MTEHKSPLQPESDDAEVELSIVIPCLNEADTIGSCINKALKVTRGHGIRAEIVVADNGSEDDSERIATELGARVVHVEKKGYGNALMGGIEASRGRFIIMGDADDSYDFGEVSRFVDKLREGHDLVQGCRLPSGGGTILPGAMPWLHRWWGNPMFTWLVKVMFAAPIHDVYCGLRGFTRKLYDRLALRSTGMEFATEMVIKSSLMRVSIAEVPITLHPDGRKSHAPHLRTFRDGWRTLRFFLMCSPRWLYFTPGLALGLAGVGGYALAMPGITLWGATFDAHTLLLASLSVMLGFQLMQFALVANTFAVTERLIPPDSRVTRLLRVLSLERCLGVGGVAFLAGVGLIGTVILQWQAVGFGDLVYADTMRRVVPGVTLAALGFQTMFAGFLLSILSIARRE